MIATLGVAEHTELTCACREKAKGATFFEATEGETVRPMLDVSWAPMLGAFSVLFEEFSEGTHSWHVPPRCINFICVHLCHVDVIRMCHTDIAWSRLRLGHVLAAGALHA